MKDYAPSSSHFIGFYVLQMGQEVLVAYMETVFIFS